MTAEKEALYNSIMSALTGLEERAVINNDKISEARLELSRYITVCDSKFSVYEGWAKGLAFAVKVLSGVCAGLVSALGVLAWYYLKAKGVL